MNLESTTQMLGFCWSSRRTWISDSSERRKKPRREGSGFDNVEVTETETVTLPVCVNPNFSKRIIARSSDRILRDLISAVEGAVNRKKRMRMLMTILLKILIFYSPVADGGGRRWSEEERWKGPKPGGICDSLA
ncbi:hypothetical protein L1987_04847 [Smallanthus sonchifolius]|uniref:Uncharacterized protein n=1 Tax=Smallanthus sonchifolius TaxID=185202 RepID=A0ACB9JTX1_9ASTR|nr:hypothetical protein L1987_04847 [Smallanthus sonchifolius]